MADIAEMLVQEEGEVLHAYQDHLGYWTVGVGRLIDRRKGGGISREESRILLDNDIARMVKTAQTYPWYGGLDDARKAAIINMLFQLGPAGFAGFKRTIGHIAAGRYTEAADEMLNSEWARQTPGRAHRCARAMRTGEWQWGA